MATRLPPVHALSAFETAARLSSFALAAEELCITPSALSHRIRLLEDFAGERLFLRDGRSISLSEFGRRYLKVVRTALRTLTDFPMPHRSAQVQPRIKVTAPPTFARYLLLPRLAEFTRLHPEIAVELFVSVPLYDLSLSESDVEIRFGAGQYPNIVTAKLFEEPAFVVASPRYLAQIAPVRVPAHLRHATLLRSALEPWQPWFEAAGLDWVEPTGGVRVDDLGLLLEAIKHGHGIGLSREHFARDMLARGEIVRLFDIQLATPPHAYYVVYDQQVSARPEVALFIEWLMQTYIPANLGIKTGTNAGMNTGMSTNVDPATNTGINRAVNRAVNTAVNRAVNTSVNTSINTGTNPGISIGLETGPGRD